MAPSNEILNLHIIRAPCKDGEQIEYSPSQTGLNRGFRVVVLSVGSWFGDHQV